MRGGGSVVKDTPMCDEWMIYDFHFLGLGVRELKV